MNVFELSESDQSQIIQIFSVDNTWATSFFVVK